MTTFVTWGMLGLMSRLSPHAMARQTLAIFSTHAPDDGLQKNPDEAIKKIAHFQRGRSSCQGALTDAAYTVGADLLEKVHRLTLI
jgi:hypothetical protein